MIIILTSVSSKLTEQYVKMRNSDLGQKVEILHIKISQTKCQEVALDREKHFELIYTIVKVFVFEVKNAIV